MGNSPIGNARRVMNFISSFSKVLQGIQKEIADTEEKLGAIKSDAQEVK